MMQKGVALSKGSRMPSPADATMYVSLPKTLEGVVTLRCGRRPLALPPAHSATLDEAHLSVTGEGAQQAEPDESQLADHDASVILPALQERLGLPAGTLNMFTNVIGWATHAAEGMCAGVISKLP